MSVPILTPTFGCSGNVAPPRRVAFVPVRAYDPVTILDEFAALLRAETDFTTEAENLEAVRRTFAANDAVTIPAWS